MKKTTFSLSLFAVVLLLWASGAFAVGTTTTTYLGNGSLFSASTNEYVVKVACVADASDGSIPNTTITDVSGSLIAVFVDMGATAPTSGAYDVIVKASSMGDADLLGGAGTNITTTSDQWITPLVGNAYVPASFVGDVVVSHTGNVVNSATPTVYLVFGK